MSDYQSQSDDYQYKVDYIRFGKRKDEHFGSMSWSFDQIIETTTDDEDNARRIARRLADEEKFARQGKEFLEYSALQDGSRVSYVDSPEYRYLNGYGKKGRWQAR